MIHTTSDLPVNYVETGRIRLDEDKRLKRRLTFSSVVILILVLMLGNFLMPILSLGLDSSGNIAEPWLLWAKLGTMLLIFVFHSLLLERLKGLIMKKLGGTDPMFAFSAGGVYAGSPVYFSKRDYRFIALLPMILVAVLFLLITMILPLDWFWVGYAAQGINLAGGAGNYYQAFQAGRRTSEVLIQDMGPSLVFYEPSQAPVRKSGTKGKGNTKRSTPRTSKTPHKVTRT